MHGFHYVSPFANTKNLRKSQQRRENALLSKHFYIPPFFLPIFFFFVKRSNNYPLFKKINALNCDDI